MEEIGGARREKEPTKQRHLAVGDATPVYTLIERPLQAFSNPNDGLKDAWQKITAGQHLMCPDCNRERDILSTDMFCETCATLLPLRYLSQEKQELWKAEVPCKFVCLKCEGQRKATKNAVPCR